MRKYLDECILDGVNILSQDMLEIGNDVSEVGIITYVIRYSYDLMGGVLELPVGSVLCFEEGGHLSNGVLVGSDSVIEAGRVGIFSGISISGSWLVPVIYSVWFDDITEDNRIKELIRLSSHDIYNEIYVDKLYDDTGNERNYLCSIGVQKGNVLNIRSNTRLVLDGTLELLGTDSPVQIYRIIYLCAENVIIEGRGKIVGDRLSRKWRGKISKDMLVSLGFSSPTGGNEYGHGIFVSSYVSGGVERNAMNVVIRGIEVCNCWGDGIVVSGLKVNGVVIDGCKIHDCGRNNLSFIRGKGIKLLNSEICNCHRTAPMACLDIEPNSGNVIEDILIENCYFENTSGLVSSDNLGDDDEEVVEEVVGDVKYYRGLVVYCGKGKVRNVRILNNTFKHVSWAISAKLDAKSDGKNGTKQQILIRGNHIEDCLHACLVWGNDAVANFVDNMVVQSVNATSSNELFQANYSTCLLNVTNCKIYGVRGAFFVGYGMLRMIGCYLNHCGSMVTSCKVGGRYMDVSNCQIYGVGFNTNGNFYHNCIVLTDEGIRSGIGIKMLSNSSFTGNDIVLNGFSKPILLDNSDDDIGITVKELIGNSISVNNGGDYIINSVNKDMSCRMIDNHFNYSSDSGCFGIYDESVNDKVVYYYRDGVSKRIGTSSERPVGVHNGFEYYDTQLMKSLYSKKMECSEDIISLNKIASGEYRVFANRLLEGRTYHIYFNGIVSHKMELYASKVDVKGSDESDKLISVIAISNKNVYFIAPSVEEYPYLKVFSKRPAGLGGISGHIRLIDYLYYDSDGFIANKSVGSTESRDSMLKISNGFRYYDTTIGKSLYWNGNRWVEEDGAVAGVLRNGLFSDKPLSQDIYIGFRYFCTDRHTDEGQIDGIEIIHKGNDIWVDALGREII